VAVVCGIIEMLTPEFFIAWFGIGAICAAVIAGAGAGPFWQISVFLAVSLTLILSTKKLASRWYRSDKEHKTNVEALVGALGFVTQVIPEGGSGQVKVGPEIWTATSVEPCGVPKGARVKVVRVEGVHLVVGASDTLE